MSRIDLPVQTHTQNSNSAKAELAHGVAPSAIRIERMRGLNNRMSIEARRRMQQMQGLASMTQVGAAGVGGLRDMPKEEIVTRLSRMLVVSERDARGSDDPIDDLFRTIAREHIRRLMLSRRSEA
ncbi:MAG: hypothetical protein KDJ48_09405 [Nitratireductor sp.]|nr:hypothetical protein [Nitratireductor sp.]MCB1454852.1 hypothetical protein [Nitratireductor sp.]MCB1459459.1 hypothetical protein [Nitratireductor sp.]